MTRGELRGRTWLGALLAVACHTSASADPAESASFPAAATPHLATAAPLPSAPAILESAGEPSFVAPSNDNSPPAASAPPEASAPPVALASAPAPGGRRVYAVAAVGDSLTDFRSHGGVYLRILQERCPKSRFDSYGKGGDMVNQMRRRLGKDLLDQPPALYTHMIVFGGVNDLYSDLTANRTVPKIESDLTAMYLAAHQRKMKVIALTVAPWGGFKRYFTEARGETTRELNRWIMRQPSTKVVDFAVDVYPLLSCGEPEKLCDSFMEPFHDGLHFGKPGHQKIADALYEGVFSDCL